MGVDWLPQPGGWRWARLGHLHIGTGGNLWSVMVEGDGDSVLRGLASGRADGPEAAKATAEAWVRDFALGLLRDVDEPDDGTTLAAIRDALGCEPGGEVEAVRLVVDEHQRTIEAFAIATDVLDRVTVELGCVAGDDLVQAVQEVKDEGASARALLDAALRAHAPTPGDVLRPEDFGRGEAGVLRLAALLSDASVGAVVECRRGHRWHWKGDGLWVSAAVRRSLLLVEAHAPLTVVAWPS